MNPGEPDELKRVTVDVTFTVITCADCAGRDRIDPSKIRMTSTELCMCGCGDFLFLCQICGKVIGGGIAGGQSISVNSDITVINGRTDIT